MAANANLLDVIADRMSHERDQFTQTVEALRRRARQELNPRRQLRRHFNAAIGVSAVAGAVLGLMASNLFRRS